jgi:DNA-directed RNA polymerase subunit RPC12/RpoP
MFTELKVAYDFGKIGFDIIQKIRGLIKKNDPAYKEIEKLYDIISGMKDSINLAKDKYFELSMEKRAIEEKFEEFKKIEAYGNSFEKEMVSPGAQVVTTFLEANLPNHQPPTWYCAGCFTKRELGVMQFCDVKAPYFVYQCTKCQNKILVKEDVHNSRTQK